MTKKHKKNTPKKHPIFFGFFRVFAAVATYKLIEKRLKKSPKKFPCTLFAHFFFRKFPEGSFSGFFRTFQLQIGGKISVKKGVFWVFFGQNFCFFFMFTASRPLVPHFTWGENSHFVFFAFFFRTVFENRKRLRSEICEKNFAEKKRRTP
jgi:ABC-type antimicrobial peptide transport system permease subunit